jgi:hypothetical protein
MSIQPFKSKTHLVTYATRFLRNRVSSFRKDTNICMTADEERHHAYFPALITCIAFSDFLSGLHAGNIKSHSLPELKDYIHKFFKRPADYQHLDILYEMFRHKIAHICYPYLVFHTSDKPKLPKPNRRVTWTVGIYKGKPPIRLDDTGPRRDLKTITPWEVEYDSRMLVSLSTFRDDIVASIYGPSGYLKHLETDPNARSNFAKWIKVYMPPA